MPEGDTSEYVSNIEISLVANSLNAPVFGSRQESMSSPNRLSPSANTNPMPSTFRASVAAARFIAATAVGKSAHVSGAFVFADFRQTLCGSSGIFDHFSSFSFHENRQATHRGSVRSIAGIDFPWKEKDE